MIGTDKLIFLSDSIETRGYDSHRAGRDNLFAYALNMTASRFPGVAKIFDRPSYLSDSEFLRNFPHHFHHSWMRMRMFVSVQMAGDDSCALNFQDLGLQLALDLIGLDYPGSHTRDERGE